MSEIISSLLERNLAGKGKASFLGKASHELNYEQYETGQK
jgi:hypothetical protein